MRETPSERIFLELCEKDRDGELCKV